MILSYKEYDLFGSKFLEHVIFKAPLRYTNTISDSACFFYSVNGAIQLLAKTDKVNLYSKQGVMVRCGSYLAKHVSLTDEPMELVAIHFQPEVLEKIYKDKLPKALIQAEDDRDYKKQFSKMQADHLVENYMEGLLFYFKNPSLINEELLILKFRELVMLLIKTDSPYAEQLKLSLQHLFNPLESSLKEVVEANLFENLTLQELAGLSHLSLSSFKRKFHQVYGQSPARYMRHKRLDKASELLMQEDMRVSEACYQAGFNDITSFTKLFTRHFGLSPSKYRQKALSQNTK